MEGSGVQDASWKARSRGSKKRNSRLVLIAAIVAGALIVSGIVLAGTKFDSRNPPNPFFAPGDHLIYSLSGNDIGTDLEGTEEISAYPGAWDTMTGGNASNYIDAARFVRSADDPGTGAGNHRINTTWGEKTVSTYLWHHDGPNYQGRA